MAAEVALETDQEVMVDLAAEVEAVKVEAVNLEFQELRQEDLAAEVVLLAAEVVHLAELVV